MACSFQPQSCRQGSWTHFYSSEAISALKNKRFGDEIFIPRLPTSRGRPCRTKTETSRLTKPQLFLHLGRWAIIGCSSNSITTALLTSLHNTGLSRREGVSTSHRCLFRFVAPIVYVRQKCFYLGHNPSSFRFTCNPHTFGSVKPKYIDSYRHANNRLFIKFHLPQHFVASGSSIYLWKP